jgi:hypothetical protein
VTSCDQNTTPHTPHTDRNQPDTATGYWCSLYRYYRYNNPGKEKRNLRSTTLIQGHNGPLNTRIEMRKSSFVNQRYICSTLVDRTASFFFSAGVKLSVLSGHGYTDNFGRLFLADTKFYNILYSICFVPLLMPSMCKYVKKPNARNLKIKKKSSYHEKP